MLPNIRVEQYEIKNQGTFDGVKWLTKYNVKIEFADRDVAYAMKNRIDKFLQGEDYRAMYLKVRDELAELQQRTWVGLTDEDCKGMSAGDKVVAMWANRILKERNS